MSVRGVLYVVNTSGKEVEIHVETKDGWRHFTSYAGQSKKGPAYKISSHDCTPLREFKKDGKVVIKGESNPAWSSKWRFICFEDRTHAKGGAIIADNPAGGGILVESINAGGIVKFVHDYFGEKLWTEAPEEGGTPWTKDGSKEQETDDPADP